MVNIGVVDANTRKRRKYWKHWCRYVACCRVSPYLDREGEDGLIVFTGYEARVRSGAYGFGRQIDVQSVSNALGAISKSIKMRGKIIPIYLDPNKYLLPLERQIEAYRREDPPPTPQLAVPVSVAECIFIKGKCKKTTARLIATGELALIAFYFSLRVGKYTAAEMRKTSETRTVQFTVGDISFWRDGEWLRNSDTKSILAVEEATTHVTNQKYCQKSGLIRHEATNIDRKGIWPVIALALRVCHILEYGGNETSLLCEYWSEGKWWHVTPTDMGEEIKTAIVDLWLPSQGITLNDMGTHSLRVGGAIALKLNGIFDTTIKKAGRWRSMAFLQYIHNQIGHLTAGVSSATKNKVPFRNIGGMSK